MNNQLAIQLLLNNRSKLVSQKARMLERLNSEISELEKAIEELSGKKVWEIESVVIYDDESPDYIKSSIED